MTRQPTLKAWAHLLAEADVHTPGDGTPCETSHCEDGTLNTTATKRAADPAWWDQQEAHARRRITAAQNAVARYIEPEPLSAANNNWRKRDAAVHRQIEAAKRHQQWRMELDAARARLAWVQDHRPS